VPLSATLPRGTTDAVIRRLWPEPDFHTAYQADPASWGRDVLGVHLWSKQVEILESVRDHERTAVRSANGVGKTFDAAAAALWFLNTFPDSRVITTATTWPQVEKLLWHEIGRLHRHALRPLAGKLLQTELRLPDGRYALGLSTKPEHLESFQGHHAPNILLVFDEASGIPAAVFEAGEGYMTTAGAKQLLIGNPLRPQGEFHAAFHSKRAEYHRIAISALETPAFTGEPCPADVLAHLPTEQWVESRRRRWGEDSPLYRVRVLGQFPAAASDAVIPLDQVEAAQARELPVDPQRDLVTIACDVARFGDDETVIGVRVGDRVRIRETFTKKATTHTAGRLVAIAREFPLVAVRIVVDDDGVGGGVTDMVREQLPEVQVTGFNGGGQARRPTDYPNRRSELWFTAAERMAGLDLDDDDQLAADLTAPRYSFDSKGRRVVEAKAETKKRLGRSPDRGDMVLLTLVEPAATMPAVAAGAGGGSITAGALTERY
jgi:phage terminase large subunit